MSLPTYTATEFGEAILQLMPTGRAWSRDADAVSAQIVRAQGGSYARLHARSNYLLTDAFPSTTVELLPEWEATLGLPDPCAGPDPTIAQRQNHVVARLTQSNGPSIPSLTAFAAALNPPQIDALQSEDGTDLLAEDGSTLAGLTGGYAITITEFSPARADVLRADDPVYDPAWAFAWQVNAPGFVIKYFSADESYADEPLETWASRVLQCELLRLAPAHSILMFSYVTALPVATWDDTGGWSGGWAP